MTDDLDSLPDDKLSEVFAVEVAAKVLTSRFQEKGYHDGAFFAYAKYWIEDGKQVFVDNKFATDANAVLPFLEKRGDVTCYRAFANDGADNLHWWIKLGVFRGYHHAPTFARAACIALIRAKRAQ